MTTKKGVSKGKETIKNGEHVNNTDRKGDSGPYINISIDPVLFYKDN